MAKINLPPSIIHGIVDVWGGDSVYNLRKFAETNGMDWEYVLEEKDPLSDEWDAFAEAVVRYSLHNKDNFLAILNQCCTMSAPIIADINKALSAYDLVINEKNNGFLGIDEIQQSNSSIIEKPDSTIENFPPDNKTRVQEKDDLEVTKSNSMVPSIETSDYTINEKIENECKSLIVIEKTRKKCRNYGYVSVIIAFSILIVVSITFPQNKTALDVPLISIPATIAIMVLLIMAGMFQNKNEKEMRKITGYKKFSLSIYKAIINMKKIHDEPDVKYINKAKNELESVHDELKNFWGIVYEEHTSLLSLEKPIHNFIEVLGGKFIQAFSDVSADDNKIDKSLINMRIITLIHLLEFFYDDKFNQIYAVNKELANYVPKEIPKDKTRLQKLSENTNLTKAIQMLLGSASIVVGGIGVSYLLNTHPDATYEKFVDWSLYIIIPSLIAYNFYIVKRKT
ncbi:MAG: hypothetical protein KGZ37_00535 [Nitrosarchaeum sp.]|nr:hypothetical protein [Nitrosarchaeum sp.]